MQERAAKPLRVALIVGGFPVLSETFVLDHAIALLQRGHLVAVFPAGTAVEGGASHPDYVRYELEARTVRPVPLPRSRVGRCLARVAHAALGTVRHTALALRSLNFVRYGKDALSGHLYHSALQFGPDRRFDVIHAHFGWSGRPAQIMREIGALRGPLITSFHGSDITVGYRPGKRMYGQLWKHGDLFTANSRFTADRMIADGCPADRLMLWPMGAHESFFAEHEPADSADLHVIGVGRLVSVKGWDVAIKALPHAPRNCILNIVGGGPEGASLSALARDLGVADRVILHGAQPRERVLELMRKCHLFVLPGKIAADGSTEAQGVVIAEAQACGLPAIVGDLGGMPDGIRPGESGFLIPPEDHAALAATLTKLERERNTIRTMSQAARRHALERFHQSRLHDRIEDVYRSIASGEARR